MYLTMLPKTLRQHGQTFLKQDDVGGFLGDVDGAVHRDADVGRLERRPVVDAVPHEADNVPLAMQCLDNRRLLRGRHLGEHRGTLRRLGHLIRRHGGQLRAKYNRINVQTDLPADLARNDGVVTGQDLDGHAAGLEFGEGFGGGVPRRVKKGDEAEQYQVRLIRHGVLGLLLR